MIRRVKAPEPELESDRIEGHPHPRETYEFIGNEAAVARMSHAARSGRLPHAWLIAGPPGVGKATLAYRVARYVLSHGATAEGPADLFVPANDITSRQIEARAHPGLLVLTRRADEKGKMPTALKVSEIRRLSSFFWLTSATGGWRVAIVDTADDMNEEAANALLKTLEEPPERGLLLVLAHASGRLLPTIRSRCQRLELRPVDEKTLLAALERRLPDMKAKDWQALVHLAEGSLGLAFRLASEEGLELARAAENVLSTKGEPDVVKILSLADKVARIKEGGLVQFGQFLRQALANRVRARARSGQGAELDRWVALWEKLNAMFARADALHLEPRQTVLSSAQAMDSVKRHHGEI
ncbi:MAG: DNA polymerase III subunit delta' [Alphaproteobacteria bacterium]